MLGLWDGFPASPHHALLVPKRHVATWFDASPEERRELTEAIDIARARILERASPDGYNVGFNVGSAGGQTVFHLHVHVIPRYAGDVPDPRGGIRHVIPAKANYLADGGAIAAEALTPYPLPAPFSTPFPLSEACRDESTGKGAGPSLTSGGDDPLLPILGADLSKAREIDVAIAFVWQSGLHQLEHYFEDVLARDGRIRFLTGDYTGATEPAALRRLLDIQRLTATRRVGRLELRVFVTGGKRSFHPKTWIIKGDAGNVAWVGSSNLSKTALRSDGIEWNYRVIGPRDAGGFQAAESAFESLFADRSVVPLSEEWIRAYEQRRPQPGIVPSIHSPAADEAQHESEDEPPPTPNEVQQAALAALADTRARGNEAGLVVLATGLGKTWLAAFDSERGNFKRVLFVAHREEILDQARKTFRRIRPDASIGFYDGDDKDTATDILFASIQTLGRKAHLEQFPRDAFDFIVVDEFHHASAATYRRLLEHFTPKFLLGLTATPERTDGGDLLGLCGENLVFRADLVAGIEKKLLAPFHYFGVPDNVEYANIPWRSSRFDEAALTQAVATTERAKNVLEQHKKHRGARTLAFCVSQAHADFMKAFFEKAGVRAASVHSGAGSDPRTDSLERLTRGELDVVFAVDMFNEGVDVPAIDTVMMLRPTESRLLWLQQLGRGLRLSEGKTHLTVIDYIGNHRTFLLKAQTLLALGMGEGADIKSDAELSAALKRLDAGDLEFPPGCEVTYELTSVDILRSLLRVRKHDEALKVWYEEFRERHDGVRPKAIEAMHDGYLPRSTRKAYGSWLRFCKTMGDLLAEETAALDAAGEFLDHLEITPMQKSYKMVLLQALLNRDAFPGELPIDDLTEEFARIAKRTAKLRQDVGPDLERTGALRSMLKANPVAAWVGGISGSKDTKATGFFAFEKDRFRSLLAVPAATRTAFQTLARELVEWRLAEYLNAYAEETAPEGRVLLKVSHAGGGNPMIFLHRDKHPSLPHGWTDVTIDGDPYTANFVKEALNVVRKPNGEANDLPRILRGWFGPDAGLSGTDHQVALDKTDDAWRLSPGRGVREQGRLEIGRSYAREEIPPLLGLKFHPTIWQQGFIPYEKEKLIILLVTLNKGDMQAEHQYQDKFLENGLFQWQSQNRTTQSGKHGQMIRHHAERGIHVHLFVRTEPKIGSRAAPFVYRGELQFESWDGDKPITVCWSSRS